MPTYEYLCQNCGERLEVFQKFTAKPLKKHDVCGGSLQKVFHASGVVFKGSGYYVTDSRSNGSGGSKEAKSTSNGSNGSSEGKAKADSKSESKSESKSDSKTKSSSKSGDSSAD